MKKLLIICLILLGGAISNAAPLEAGSPVQRKFVENAAKIALKLSKEYGIPASSFIAQAAYESNYGRSTLARRYNNYFGIKAFDDWHGAKTPPVRSKDGVYRYRAYSSMEDSFIGYAEFLKKNRYKRAFKETDGQKFIKVVLASGYCPDDDYMRFIRSIYYRHNLYAVDRS